MCSPLPPARFLSCLCLTTALALCLPLVARADERATQDGRVTQDERVTQEKPLLSPVPSPAAVTPSATPSVSPSASPSEPPVLLNAERVIYDDDNKQVIAEGSATFAYRGQMMQADRMVYDQKQDLVTAEGNVRIWGNTNDMMFMDKAILSRDMQQAFVQQVSMVMNDNSRFVAMEGERTEGRYIRMNRALYTACDVCRDDPSKPPVWQVRAERVIHDSVRKDVYYRNAWLEMGGVPVFYTPYLSVPDPTVKQRSGFIAPIVGSRNNLGLVARSFYYLDVSPTMDATVETSYSGERGFLVGVEWRQALKNGHLQVNASGTRDNIPLDNEANQFRGHFFLDGEYKINENWVASASIKRTTDDTFLDLWDYSNEDILTSRAQVEYYQPRVRGVVEAISFQDLRSNDAASEPQILNASWTTQGAPNSLLGGRATVSTQLRGITRPEGQDSTRFSVATGWRRQDVLPVGFLFTSEALARLDAYAAQEINSTATNDNTTVRPYAQTQFTTSWPLARTSDGGQHYLEPIAQLTLAPRQKRETDDIPNEDSVGLEYDTTTLFSTNRYAGNDRLDGGQRLAYGIKSGWSGVDGSSLNVTLGQSYDFADHPNYPSGSGLASQDSDYVGAIDAIVPDWADAAYAVRFDNETLEAHEHDLRLNIGPEWLQGSTSYIYAEEPAQDASASGVREEIAFAGRWTFVPRWTVAASHRRDLQHGGQSLTSGLKLEYQDECFAFSVIAHRDYVAREGLSDGDSIFFRLRFKNLGEFESPSLSPDTFSGSD